MGSFLHAGAGGPSRDLDGVVLEGEIDGRLAGLLAVVDPIEPSMVEALASRLVESMQKAGHVVAMALAMSLSPVSVIGNGLRLRVAK